MIGQAVRLQKAGVTMVLVEYSSLFQGGMGASLRLFCQPY